MDNVPHSLAVSNLKINPSSYVDPNGFAFHYGEEIYRAIYPAQEDFYKSIFASGLVDKLIEKYNLVESSISPYSIPELNCGMVIKHRKIEPLTYCVEWPLSLLKSAAITTLELNLELLEHNCILQDAYPWNVLFEGTTPVFVDLTSIVPLQTNLIWPAYQQFVNFFLNPLKLAALGKGRIARGLLFDYINGVSGEDLFRNLTVGYCFKHPLHLAGSYVTTKLNQRIQNNQKLKLKIQGAIKANAKPSSHMDGMRKRFLRNLLKEVQNIKIKGQSTTWMQYYDELTAEFKSDEKIRRVKELLQNLKPRTVLDVGCNVGKYSLLAADAGARVLSMDSSEDCMEFLYQVAKERKLKITPIVSDVLCPTPAFGFMSEQFPPLVERFQSDLVLCLGIMHHLHISGRQSFSRIAKLLNQLTKKYVIFEYVDATDNNNQLIDHGRKVEYSLESVSSTLSRYFKITTFASDRDTRKLLLCEKN